MTTPRYIAARPSVLLAALGACALILAFALAAYAVQAQGQDVTAEPAATGDEPPVHPGRPTADVTHDSVTLTWAESPTESVTHYAILRRNPDTDAPGAFQVIEADAGPGLSYTDSTVAAESRYVYRVKAVSPTGVSRWSGYVNADTPAAPEPTATPEPTAEPTATPEPADVTTDAAATGDSPPGQPGQPQATVVTHDYVTITWAESSDDTVTHYAVLRRNRDTDAGGVFHVIQANAGPGVSYTDSTVAAESRYVYRVKAVSPTGVSQWSSYANADTPAAPDPASLAPSGLSAASAHGLGVALTWDAPEEDAGAVTGYEVLRAQGAAELTTLAADTGSADTSYTDATATEPGESYAYRVKALRGGEKSQASNRTTAFIPKATEEGEPPTAERQGAANNEATGKPTISGIIAVGQILSAVTSGIMDDDGIPADAFSYQWLRVDGDTEAPIGGATTSSYMLASDDTGKQVKVRVTFTDSANFPESRTSDATPTVVAPSLIDGDLMLDLLGRTRGLCGTAATIWVSTTVTDDFPGDKLFAYDRATGARHPDRDFNTLHGAGNNGPIGIWCDGETMFVVDFEDKQVYAYKMEDDPGTPDVNEFAAHDSAKGSSAVFLSGPRGIWGNADTIWVSNSVTGNSLADEILAYHRSNFTRDSGKDFNTLHSAGNNDPGGIWSDGETMWVVDTTDDKLYAYQMSDKSRDGSKDISLGGGNDHPQGVWGDADVGKLWVVDVLDSRLYAYELPRPATGLAITGTAQVGETLTADTSGITDANGIPDDVAYTYQWTSSSDGTTYANIGANATASTYTLVAADQGKMIKVEVTFTDEAGFTEKVTSDATVAVAAQQTGGNNPAAGQPDIGDTAQVGQALTADTSRITDADNIPTGVTYAYAWSSSRDGTDYAPIAGAGDAASYTPVKADLNRNIRVQVSFTDSAGNAEAVTSDATGRVSPAALAAIDLATANNNPSGVWGNETTIWVVEDDVTPGNKVFAYDLDGDRVSELDFNLLDGADNENPRGLWSDGVTMYVLDREDRKVYAYTMVENPATTATEFGQRDASKDFTTITANNDRAQGLWGNADHFWAAEDDSSLNLVFAYNRSDGQVNSIVNFGSSVIHGEGIRDPRGLHSDGETMFVVDAGDEKVYALKMSDQTRDADRDIALDPANEDAEGLWYGNGVLWVADKGDDKLYRYRLSYLDENDLPVYNLPPDGMPTISGAAEVGQTLTASTSGITDVNGVPTGVAYTYRWKRGGAVHAPIAGATGSTYTLTGADADHTIKVEVGFTDDDGFLERVSSAATAAVPNSNQPATGAAITGMVWVGQKLTAVTSDITDADGVPDSPAYTYQWSSSSDGTTYADIDTATSSTYTLVSADVGNTIRVTVGFTDSVGFAESVASDATAAISAQPIVPNNPATGKPDITGTAQVGEPLTADTSNITDADDIPDDAYRYQWSSSSDGSTYTDIENATSAVFRPLQTELGKTLKVTVTFTDGAGFTETVASDATAAAVASPHGNVIYSAKLTVGVEFIAPTRYGYYGITFNTYGELDPSELTPPGSGSMKVNYLWYGGNLLRFETNNDVPQGDYILFLDGSPFPFEGLDFDLRFSDHGLDWNEGQMVEVRLSQNRAATGTATITGTPQVGQTLTAGASGFEDDDDIPGGVAYTYQWTSSDDGSTYTDIEDATERTYFLVLADLGKTIKVEVSFTDEVGFEETVTSEATVGVAATTNNLATGQPAIRGTAQVGEPLTADTSGIADADDIPDDVAYSYQWSSSDDGSTYTNITGATDAVFRPLQTELGKTLKVTVTFTDGVGFTETVASDATGAVAPSPYGNVIYSATLTVGVDNPPSGTRYGYDSQGVNAYGEIDPSRFDVPGGDRFVHQLRYIGNGRLFFDITALPDGDYILFLDGEPFPFEGLVGTTEFSDHGLDWNEGQMVKVRLSQNRAATGLPTISGTAQVGQTLTADVSGIADDDTIPAYSYQWFSSDDGATYTDIEGATGPIYNLVAADEGKRIKVQVSFTDSVGFEERLSSDATGEVAPFTPPGLPTNLRAWTAPGRVTISWDAPEGAPAATGYIVERDLPKEWRVDPVMLRDDPQDDETTYVDYTDFEMGTRLHYFVSSVVTHGGETFRSESVPVRFDMGPHGSAYAPRNVRATKFLVTWDPPAVNVVGDVNDDVAAAMDKGDRPDDEWVTAYCIEVIDWHWRKLPPYGEEGDVRIVSNLNSDWKVAAFVEKDKVAVVKEDETVESCHDGYEEDQVERITGSGPFEVGAFSVDDIPKLATGHSVAVRMFATNDGGKVWSGHTFLDKLEKNEDRSGYHSTGPADVFIDRGDVDLPDLWKPNLRSVPLSEASFVLLMASNLPYDLYEIEFIDLQRRTGGGEWENQPNFDRQARPHYVFPPDPDEEEDEKPYSGNYTHVERDVQEEDCGTVEHRVRVINSLGEESPWSDPVTPTCGAANQPVRVPPDDGDGESPTSAEAGAIIPEDDAPVWSATLTTGALGAGNGYDSAFYDPSVGSLSPATFEIDDVAYTVTMIEAAGWMYIGLDRELPTNFKLEVDGAELDSGDASFASYSYADIYRWEDAEMVWDEGDTIEMRLFLGDGDSG